jgi:hypothetical protein
VAVDIGGLVDLARDARHEAFENPDCEGHVKEAVGERDGDVRVEQAEGGIELEEWQGEHGGGRHAVGEQPEEQVLVAEEAVAREGVGGGQGYGDGDDGVETDIDQRVAEHGAPAFIRENLHVIVEVERLREEREARGDLEVRLETHRDEPIDRRHQEENVERRDEPGEAALFHGLAPGWIGSPSSRVITV